MTTRVVKKHAVTKRVVKKAATKLPLPFDAKEAVRALSKADPNLAKWIAKVGPFTMELNKTNSVFEALAQSIVYQQLHGKAAATILARVKAKVGSGAKFNAKNLLATSDADLRACGLSKNKMLALQDLARKTLDGTLPKMAKLGAMHEDEIIERLTAVRGIGVWTVHMFLIFRLGRPDILPIGDFGVRKGFARVFKIKEMPLPGHLTERAEKWRPYRSIASWYMWRVADWAEQAGA
jgi:DNA-3-methyladenine glycosylase II